jgi:hypothetical protein
MEAHNSVDLVERYHGPLRLIYQIITEELPDLDRDAALQMAFKALNDSAGPDGLIPTLLVSRMIETDAPPASITQRAAAMQKAMEEVKKLRAKRQINDALHMRNGPKVDAVHDFPLNSEVLVWREGQTNKLVSWNGPYVLLRTNGE